MTSLQIVEKIVSILFSLIIFLNAYASSIISRTWYNPATIFSLFWFFFTFFPLVILFYVPIYWLAILFISLSCILFSASLYFFNWPSAHSYNIQKKNKTYFNSFVIKLAFIFIGLIVLFFYVIDLYLQGYSVELVLFNYFETASEFTGKKYAEDIKANFFSQSIYVLSYVLFPLGGILFLMQNNF